VARSRGWLPPTVLIAGLALTFFAGYFATRTVTLRNRAEFDRTAQHATADIDRSVQTYIAVLRGLAGYFAAETNVTAGSFAAYVKRLRMPENYPGAQGVGFSLRIKADQIAELESSMVQQGVTNFHVWPKSPDREEYHAILFLEPRNFRNAVALGYDMFSDPLRRNAMIHARDTGRSSATARVTLVQEIQGPKQPGFLIYTPVYRGGDTPDELSARGENLHGFVYSPFRFGDLIETVLGPEFLKHVDFRIYDGTTLDAASEMFRSTPVRNEKPSWFESSHSIQVPLSLAGRTWTLSMKTSPQRMSGWWIAPLVIVTGIGISFVLWFITRAESRARKQAEAYAVQLQSSEAALRDSEARLRLILESARDYAILAMNLQGQIVSWNTGAERTFRFTEAEVLGQNGGIIFTPEDKAVGAHQQELEQARSTGMAEDDRWHMRKDGSRVYMSGIVRLMKDSSDKPIGFLKVARDVTERLEAEARLRHEKELSEKIINSLPGIFYLFDQDGRWLRWNENLQDVSGFSAEEISGRHPTDFVHPQDRERISNAIGRVIEHGHATVEADLITKTGRSIPHLFYGRRIMTEGRVCVMGMGVDISERKRAEGELREAEERLRGYTAELEQRVVERTADLSRSLGSLEDLLYHVAHDLRAPLRSMASFTKILLEDYAVHLDERARDYAGRISNSAHFMDELVHDLLAYGHLSHSQIKLTNVNLERHVDAVLEQFSPQLKTRGAQVEVSRPLPEVKAAPAIVSEIIINLVDNALKFVPPDRQARIHIWAHRNNSVRLWIEDNGIGIRPEYHNRIFRLFERLHGSGDFPGTGIGLAIVAKGAERLGGRAGVESTPGQGSRFWVEFPVADTASALHSSKASEEPSGD